MLASDSPLTAPLAPLAAPLALSSQLLHDLRTPLHQIIGYAEMLGEQAHDEGRAELADDLHRVRLAGKQLLSLFDGHFSVQNPSQSNGDLAGDPAISPAPAPLIRTVSPSPSVGGETASLVSPARILVVDDNQTNREVLSRLLSRHKYEVESEAGGLEALERVRAQASGAGAFDLILLDVMMPLMDGYDVLGALKADDATRHVPVIMISAIGEIDSVVRCIELGAEDYLPKPFNPTLLQARISACLEKKRGRDREVRLFAQLQENFARLEALEKIRDDLTHMIVHDLRTPLSSFIAGLQTMPLAAPLESEQQECLDIAMRGGYMLLDMINDLLDLSKMESGQMELQLETVSIPALIERACEQVAATAQSRNLEIQVEIAPGVLLWRLDADKMGRTLVNLLGNAVKFTPRGGKITLKVRPSEAALLFEVKDTGEGIPAADLERIFDKFAQVEGQRDGRRNGRQGSSGIGLALCKMVVEAHGGTIWAQSEVGQGSTFSLNLPAS